MKNLTWSVGLIVAGLILLFGGCNTYNSLVNLDEDVENEWGKVQSAYQRRADLIPNLVNTVKGYAEYEKSTFTAVVEARAKATQTKIDANYLDAAAIQKYEHVSLAQQFLFCRLVRVFCCSRVLNPNLRR